MVSAIEVLEVVMETLVNAVKLFGNVLDHDGDRSDKMNRCRICHKRIWPRQNDMMEIGWKSTTHIHEKERVLQISLV
jgi:hypothetical protein